MTTYTIVAADKDPLGPNEIHAGETINVSEHEGATASDLVKLVRRAGGRTKTQAMQSVACRLGPDGTRGTLARLPSLETRLSRLFGKGGLA